MKSGQVVPLCSAVSLLFLTELRSMQRVVESLGDARPLDNSEASNLVLYPEPYSSHDWGW